MFILFQDMLNKENAAPKPDTMIIGQIKSELERRGLSTIGTKSELKARLTQDDLSTNIHLNILLKTLFAYVLSSCYGSLYLKI